MTKLQDLAFTANVIAQPGRTPDSTVKVNLFLNGVRIHRTLDVEYQGGWAVGWEDACIERAISGLAAKLKFDLVAENERLRSLTKELEDKIERLEDLAWTRIEHAEGDL